MYRLSAQYRNFFVILMILTFACGKNTTTNEDSNFENINIKLISIPGGTFQMGDIENMGNSDEKPVHSVKLSAFQISEAEITNAQYCLFLENATVKGYVEVFGQFVKGKRGTWKGQIYYEINSSTEPPSNKYLIHYENGIFFVKTEDENLPVVGVTWCGAEAFAEFYGFNLPREAEWEYVCRGGKQYSYGTDDGSISISKANYSLNGEILSDVKSFPCNSFGVYDMSGNVWEYCADWYGEYTSANKTNPLGPLNGEDRIMRGGSFLTDAIQCRSSNRATCNLDSRGVHIGFRVVRRQ
jgi:formylglycine-generating enzyme required for sulfatase activity